jgi:hypothetical protein
MKLRHLFTFHGKLKRFEYATTGLLLVAVKYNIDRAIAYFGYHEIFYPTDYFNYFTDPDFYLLNTNFMYALAFTAVPFIAIGTVLTIKRLRDIGLPTWMVVFSNAGKELSNEKWLDRFIPESDNGSAAVSIVITSLLSLLMAAPLALIIAIVGAFVGYTIQKRKIDASAAIFLIFGTLPLLSGAEHTSSKEATLRQVTSEIVINRSSSFTTGAFIEPIEVWDEPNLLKFSVAQVPPPLVELSFYNDLHLPHLEGYFSSEKGQFKLISLSKNKTLLQGTTWYRHKISPGFYWRLWSDHILHAIHYRVLDHIKFQTEKNWKEDISLKARR